MNILRVTKRKSKAVNGLLIMTCQNYTSKTEINDIKPIMCAVVVSQVKRRYIYLSVFSQSVFSQY